MKPPQTPSQPPSVQRTAFSVFALAGMVFFGRDACICGGGGGNRPPPPPQNQPDPATSATAPSPGSGAPGNGD